MRVIVEVEVKNIVQLINFLEERGIDFYSFTRRTVKEVTFDYTGHKVNPEKLIKIAQTFRRIENWKWVKSVSIVL